MSAIVLVVYTVVVWFGRIRNVIGADDISAIGKTWRVVVAAIFLGLAGAVVLRWRDRRMLATLSAWTIVFWLVRGTGMLFGDEDTSFKVVHTLLTVGSIAIASWAWPGRKELART